LVINLRSPDKFSQKVTTIAKSKDEAIILYCAPDARSGMAADFLQQSGYTAVSIGVNASMVVRQLSRTIERN